MSNVHSFLVEHPGTLIWIPLLLVALLRGRSEVVGALRRSKDLCAQCGRPSPAQTVGDLTSKVRLCDECALRTRRSHRVGFIFFLGMGLLGFVLTTFGLISDVRHGNGVSPGYLLMYGLGAVTPFVFALAIRHQDRR